MRHTLDSKLADYDIIYESIEKRERIHQRNSFLVRAGLELGGLGLTYLALSGVDSMINDMSFMESLMTPLTYLKAAGYVAYSSRLPSIVLFMMKD